MDWMTRVQFSEFKPALVHLKIDLVMEGLGKYIPTNLIFFKLMNTIFYIHKLLSRFCPPRSNSQPHYIFLFQNYIPAHSLKCLLSHWFLGLFNADVWWEIY